MKIKNIAAIWILDSRGVPTVHATVESEKGVMQASVPSGASVGKFEAVEKRDGIKTEFAGKGVKEAVANVNTKIRDLLVGNTYKTINEVDEAMRQRDGTENKSNLGANAMLAVSLACTRLFALEAGLPLYAYLGLERKMALPTPMMNILNGGAHASNNIDIQEFMVMPVGAETYPAALQMGAEIYAALKAELAQKGLSTAVGDEGGFAPNLRADEEALEYIMQAVKQVGVEKEIVLALDAAASEWVTEKGYLLPKSKKAYTSEELVAYYKGLVEAYPIASIEDPMGEEDYAGFAAITKALPIQIVGDDLFVTNTTRIKQGIEEKLANAILIKLNQIGTVSETIAAVDMGNAAGFSSIISHRSGETEDSFIADFSVGLGTGQIKTGAPARGERTAKYNRLAMIAAEDASIPYAKNAYIIGQTK